MKVTVQQGEVESVVDLAPNGAARGPRTVLVDGKPHVVDAVYLPGGVVNLLLDGHSYDVDFEDVAGTADEGQLKVRIRGQVLALTVMDERRKLLRATASRAGAHHGSASILSPMPGKVVKLLKALGDVVKAGEGVVVVEAMKMENELRAPSAGTVKEVKVQEGQAVESGAVLVVIE